MLSRHALSTVFTRTVTLFEIVAFLIARLRMVKKLNFTANSTVRACAAGDELTEVIVPTVEVLLMAAFGGAKFGWLKMLKESARSWRRYRSFQMVFFCRLMSQFCHAGPRSMLYHEVP